MATSRTTCFGLISLLATGAGIALASAPAQAITVVTNTSSYSAINAFNWDSIGPDGTSPGNPFTIDAVSNGLQANVEQFASNSTIARQSSSWDGNFTPGDFLLTTQGTNGPITLTFSQPVAGVVTQIQSARIGAFQAKIEAFSTSNILLGSFLIDGISDNFANDSAIQIGVNDSSNSVKKIVLSVPLTSTGADDANNFAINTFEILSPTPPEAPAPLPLLGTGAAVCWSRQLRRRMKG
jgi:hypothetical protein